MYKNQLKGVPQEIIDKMLERQVEQGNKKDASVFDNDIMKSKNSNGFSWIETIEGHTFWQDVLDDKKYDLFFQRYPKNSYPKIMKVWNGSDEYQAKNRVVFAEKKGKYIAWAYVETFEEAEEEMNTAIWSNAKDIEPTPQPKEMTVEQISKELGYEIKIVK